MNSPHSHGNFTLNAHTTSLIKSVWWLVNAWRGLSRLKMQDPKMTDQVAGVENECLGNDRLSRVFSVNQRAQRYY